MSARQSDFIETDPKQRLHSESKITEITDETKVKLTVLLGILILFIVSTAVLLIMCYCFKSKRGSRWSVRQKYLSEVRRRE